jgi:hypothetical protein
MNNVAPLREQIVTKLYSAVYPTLTPPGIRVGRCAIPALSMTRLCSLAASGRSGCVHARSSRLHD